MRIDGTRTHRSPAATRPSRMMLLLCITSLHVFAQKSEFDYLPDYPGKAAATISLPQSAVYKLSAAEKAAFVASLTQLRDRLLAQPSLNPPRGIEVKGEIGSLGGTVSSLNPSAGLLKEPVQAFGTLFYCFYYRNEAGKPVYHRFSTWEIQIAVNDPVSNGPNESEGGDEQILDEPKKVGDIQGFPVYRSSKGNEFIVLCRTGKPYWLPITREQYVNFWIKLIEEDIAKDGPLADHMERLKRHKAAIARMSPAERQVQARHLWNPDAYEPPLAPIGSKEGNPLITVNPEWYNPSLPRTAFQLITVKFAYRGDLDPDHPAPLPSGFISAFRLYETLHTSDWKAISAVLGN